MNNINEEIIIKSLLFVEEHNGIVSRYIFDKYITKTFLFDESFNIIPRYLLEKKYIEIIKTEHIISIGLTETGKQQIRNNMLLR